MFLRNSIKIIIKFHYSPHHLIWCDSNISFYPNLRLTLSYRVDDKLIKFLIILYSTSLCVCVGIALRKLFLTNPFNIFQCLKYCDCFCSKDWHHFVKLRHVFTSPREIAHLVSLILWRRKWRPKLRMILS